MADSAATQACLNSCTQAHVVGRAVPDLAALKACASNCATPAAASTQTCVNTCIQAHVSNRVTPDLTGLKNCTANCSSTVWAPSLLWSKVAPTSQTRTPVTSARRSITYVPPATGSKTSDGNLSTNAPTSGVPTWVLVIGGLVAVGALYYVTAGNPLKKNPAKKRVASKAWVKHAKAWFRSAGLVNIREAKRLKLSSGRYLAICLRATEPNTGNVTVLTRAGQVRQYYRQEVA